MKIHHLFKNSAILLLLAEVFLIISSVLWTDGVDQRPWLKITYTLLFCAAGYSLAQSKTWVCAYIPLTLAAIVFSSSDDHLSVWIHSLSIMLIHIMLFSAVIKHSFFKHHVPRTNRIIAGVTGYILIGLFWNNLLILLTSLESKPLLNQATSLPPDFSDHFYFVFVTLTTLGYGDIIPITAIAKVITIFISLTGTLYLAVFISSLIATPKK